MVAWGDVKQWDPDAIGAVADELNTQKRTLVGLQNEVDDARAPGTWIGEASEGARTALRGHVQRLEEITAGVSAAFLAADDAEASARTNSRLIEEVLELAGRHHFTISDDGHVESRPPFVLEEDETRTVLREDIELKVLQVLNTADQIDDYLADIMQRVADGGITDGEATTLSDAAAEGQRQTSRTIELERLLTAYQVDADPEGMVDYRRLWQTERVTATEAGLLDELGLFELRDLSETRSAAMDAAAERFPETVVGDHDHRNAFQHAYWNALMAREFGGEWAEEFGTAHEMIPGNPADQEAMDLHNNEIGRRIAADHPEASDEELADLVEEAVREGRTVVIPEGGGLQFTDRLGFDETGAPGRMPPEEGDPELGREYGDPTVYGDPDNYD